MPGPDDHEQAVQCGDGLTNTLQGREEAGFIADDVNQGAAGRPAEDDVNQSVPGENVPGEHMRFQNVSRANTNIISDVKKVR